MRTKILELYPGLVKLVYSTDDGERLTRYFLTPDTGGYVREWDSRGTHPQVCEGLGRRGSTLVATPDSLVSVIRREWRRYRESLI